MRIRVVKTSPQSPNVTILPSVGEILRLNWLILSCRKGLRAAVLPPATYRKVVLSRWIKTLSIHAALPRQKPRRQQSSRQRSLPILGDLISFLFIAQAYAGLPPIRPRNDPYPRLIRANSARFHNAFVTNNVHKAVSTTPRSWLSNRSAAIPDTKSIRNGIATN